MSGDVEPGWGVRTWLVVLLAALTIGCGGTSPPSSISVGATENLESILLAHIYAAALRSSGAAVEVRETTDGLKDLTDGALTVFPGFTGTLLSRMAPRAAGRSPEHVYRMLLASLPEGIGAGDYATAAENKPALVVTRATVSAWGGGDLSVLDEHCRDVSVGAATGRRHPARVGRCTLGPVQRYGDDAAAMSGVRAGRITAAWVSTAAPGVSSDLVMLADRKPPLVRSENAIPLYRRNVLGEPQLLVLNQVAGVLDTSALVTMGAEVRRGEDPRHAAEHWLYEHPLVP